MSWNGFYKSQVATKFTPSSIKKIKTPWNLSSLNNKLKKKIKKKLVGSSLVYNKQKKKR